MKITSPIYGSFEIAEPVLLDLIQSEPVLRLKKISQHGVPTEYYDFPGFSRYEHSVGVMLSLRKLGASIEEQAAGLIHDVSHLAFSHVADWVFGKGNEGNEDLQDSLHEAFIGKSEIPKILLKNGFKVDQILDEKNFPLLENKIPDVCADRFDYAVQEFYRYLKNGTSIVKECLEGIMDYQGGIVFSSKEAALLFAENFLYLQKYNWGSERSIVRYSDFAEILKQALKIKIIVKEDFFGDEDSILLKLKNSNDEKIVGSLQSMADASFIQKRKQRGERMQRKFRYVDPKILISRKTRRVSELFPEFSEKIELERKRNQEGIIV